MVTDARLLACAQRVRVRCELFLGLLTQIQDDLAAMAQVGDPPEGRVSDSWSARCSTHEIRRWCGAE